MLAGVLPPGTPIETADDALVEAGHGITDLLKLVSPRDEATDAAAPAGVGPLWQKIAIWRPAAVVFIYKRAASAAAGRELPEPWGHLKGVALAGRPCLLMPGPYATTEQVDEGLNFVRNLVVGAAGGSSLDRRLRRSGHRVRRFAGRDLVLGLVSFVEAGIVLGPLDGLQ